MKHSILAILFGFTSIASFATTCPNGLSQLDGHISTIVYNTEGYSPTFTLVEYERPGVRDPFMTLAPSYGVNTDYGRAMFALVLQAQAGYFKVTVKCARAGEVNYIEIKP